MRRAREILGAWRRSLRVLTNRRAVGVHYWLRDNAYHDMIYGRFGGASSVQPLTLIGELKAFVRLPARGRVLWVHCESNYSWGAFEHEMEPRFQSYMRALQRWAAKGGQIVWTLHDNVLHQFDHDPKRLRAIRAFLGKHATMFHVPSHAAKQIVARDFDLSDDKIVVVPHPSYANHYGVAERTANDTASARRLLCFGYVKTYKNYTQMCQALVDMPAGGFERLTIAGKREGDVDLMEDQLSEQLDLDLRLRFIADDEVPALFADAHFMVLPYSESLTSGVAALAMGFGVPVIGSKLGGMQESVPVECHELLYDPQEQGALRRALERARDMTAEDYAKLRQACVAFGESIHPDKVSEQLQAVLRERLAA